LADDNVFAEKYDLLRKLGEGGMAEIFLARQRGLGGFQKELVIKRIHRALAKNEGYVELFLDEARIAANLNHPNIVHIYDIGKAYGTYYIAMEYIHGVDLMDICRRGIREQKFLPLPHAVQIISQVSEGLYFAHTFRDEYGQPLEIVHRDISPSNILVSFGGLAKLVDFGIAKAATQVHDDAGKVMGKINYMAPEQIRGEPVDARSDLFALGVVLYEICVGRRLFRGSAEEVAKKVLEEPVPPPSLVREDFPTDLEVIVMRLLEKKPENRYQDAEELHQDLEEYLAETGARAGRGRLSRYLVDLYDLDGVPLDVDEELVDDVEDELDFDRAPGACDDDFGEDDGGEVIFASRMEPVLSGPAEAAPPEPDVAPPPPPPSAHPPVAPAPGEPDAPAASAKGPDRQDAEERPDPDADVASSSPDPLLADAEPASRRGLLLAVGGIAAVAVVALLLKLLGVF